jgi:hypothetical protein
MSSIYKPLRLRVGARNLQLADAKKSSSPDPAPVAKVASKPKAWQKTQPDAVAKVSDESDHLKVVKKRQSLLKKKGLCICCGKRKANVKRGSTKLRCAVCSEKARVYGRSRYAQLKAAR